MFCHGSKIIHVNRLLSTKFGCAFELDHHEKSDYSDNSRIFYRPNYYEILN